MEKVQRNQVTYPQISMIMVYLLKVLWFLDSRVQKESSVSNMVEMLAKLVGAVTFDPLSLSGSSHFESLSPNSMIVDVFDEVTFISLSIKG